MNLIRITDLSVSGIEPYSSLSEPELMHLYEPNGGVFIAETPMIIARAIEAGYEPESLLVEEHYEAEAAAMDLDVPVYSAPMEVISHITGYKLTRGMLAVMKRKPLPTVGELLGGRGEANGGCTGTSGRPRRIAVLEDVMNPTNVGAIFRSAAALGIEAILLTKGCSDPLYRRACRVGMGTAFLVAWTYFPDSIYRDGTYDYISLLHGYGYKTVAMALRGDSVTIDDPVLRAEPRLAIILGTEGEGLKNDTITRSDYTVKIPMAAGVDSLNVAAASAVAFWELTK